MSDPFIIWTMRRTGGTTFSALLMELSEHPGAQHEPFNPDRNFGWVTESWIEKGDPELLMDGLDQVLANRPLIKHCYELVPEALNIALIEAASARGYRHIVLDRQAEVDRILSLELAKITGAWGAEDAAEIYAKIEAGTRKLAPVNIKDAVGHMLSCAQLRRKLAAQFDSAGQTPLLVYFEEIYGAFETGRKTIETLLSFLEIQTSSHPQFESLLSKALLEKNQNSRSIAPAVPNIAELRDALEIAHARDGFRFETATRSQPHPDTDAAPDRSGVIIDVSADPGDDTGYYLTKGFDVICLEQTATGLHALEARFGEEIRNGRVLVNQAQLGPRDDANPVISELITAYGRPYYVKIESNGGERALIAGLAALGAEDLPPYLSFQVNPDWEANLDMLSALGYSAFQLIRQGAAHLPAQPVPSREGRYALTEFTATMSGCFGRDLPLDGWGPLAEFHGTVRLVQAEKHALRTAGRDPGWHDIHCRL